MSRNGIRKPKSISRAKRTQSPEGGQLKVITEHHGDSPDKRVHVSRGFETSIKMRKASRILDAAANLATVGTFILAFVLAYIYGGQLKSMRDTTKIMQGQLDSQKLAERPWMIVTPDPEEITPLVGHRISAKLTIVNKGKTPARAPQAQFFMKKVINGEPYTLTTSDYVGGTKTGSIFFDIPSVHEVFLTYPNSRDIRLLQPGDPQLWNDVKFFYIVYGYIEYDDLSRRHHWTKFCFHLRARSHPEIPVNADTCTDYNDMDND